MELTRIADRIARVADPTDEQFRLLVSTVSDYAIYLLDQSGRVASWNAGAERIKGYRAGEVIGRHFSMFYAPEDRAAGMPERALANATRDGRYEAEGWRVTKDGGRFWAEVVITALRAPDGSLRGFAKVTRDMTARHAEREREQLLAAVFNHAPHGISVVDRNGRYIGGNASFLRLTGYTEAELHERTYLDLTHPDDLADTQGFFENLVRSGGERVDFDKRYVRKDGTVLWARMSVAPILDSAGAPVCFVAQV